MVLLLSWLRMPNSDPQHGHQWRRGVEGFHLPGRRATDAVVSRSLQVMDLVELTPLRNTLVGLPGASGLSVEQRKRLTIAVELVRRPLCLVILLQRQVCRHSGSSRCLATIL
jgi:ABC-type branched-subunit amino acid transport system ATPase component